MKMGAVAILATICALLIKKESPPLALALTVLVAVGVCIFAFAAFDTVRGFLDRVMEMTRLSSELVAPVFKTVCVAIVVKLIAQICRDGGEMALATAVEIAGAMVALIFMLPLLNMLLDLCLRLV